MDISDKLILKFGGEEQVDLRRQLIPLKEILAMRTLEIIQKPTEILMCGSTSDGISYPRSDMDFMIKIPSYRAVNSIDEVTQGGDFLMLPSEICAGYCRHLDITEKFDDYIVRSINGFRYISSQLVKEQMLKEHVHVHKVTIHGPCLNLSDSESVELEFTASIFVPFWPNVASEWINKKRSHGWPSNQLIQEIVKSGCYVVPVGLLDSLHCEHEWRLSFTLAERTLVHSFNHAQFLTYNLLRLMLKAIIDKKFPDVLCTYFIKTTAFYAIEKIPGKQWNLSNLEACYKSCLSVLHDFIDSNNCPNYFIPEYNMIKRKVNRENRQQLLDLIRIVIFIDINEVFNSVFPEALSDRSIECRLDYEFCFSHQLQSVLFTIKFLGGFSIADTYESIVYEILRPILKYGSLIKNQIFKFALQFGFLNCCELLMDTLSENSQMSNKQNYEAHKLIKSLLRMGYNVDLTTGKIVAATYLYLIGNIKSAISVIQQLFSKLPSYALDSMFSPPKAYLNDMCGKGYSINYKARRALVQYHFIPNNIDNVYPLSLTILKTLSPYLTFHPLTYAYFLECCCHQQLQNETLFKKSAQLQVKHFKKLNKASDKFVSAMCIGIVQYTQDNNHSACRWLGAAYFMNNELNADAALIYIACSIFKKLKMCEPGRHLSVCQLL